MSFVASLWESVFQPGTNPALIKATHVSFAMLIVSLTWMIVETRSIHFVNLLVIAVLLWVSVIWFIGELAKAKAEMKTNEELEKEAGKDAAKPEESKKEK